IPGRSLRGAAIRAYMNANGQTKADLPAPGESSRALFFADQVQFLNGYPETADGKRSWPRPHSWLTPKDKQNDDTRCVRDLAQDLSPTEDDTLNLKREKAPFVHGSGKDVHYTKVSEDANVHNASIDPMRKDATNSNVFRYRALERGQRFVSYVLSEDAALLAQIRQAMPSGIYHLGGSHAAGYGTVHLAVGDVEADWSEGAAQPAKKALTVVTLLSDVILQDQGQPMTDFTAYLSGRLGRTLKAERVFAATTTVGAFNRKWGLPQPQQVALAMGSTYVYAASDLPLSDLKTMVQQGVGLHRGEGFGRLAVNLFSEDSFDIKPAAARVQAGTPNNGQENHPLATRMATRRLELAAEQALAAYLKKVTLVGRPPANTQLSRLRTVLRAAEREGDLAPIMYHLDNLRRAKEQFTDRHLKVGDDKLSWYQWLRKRSKCTDGLAQLGLEPTDAQYAIAGATPEADKELNLRITARLIDAVLRQTVKTTEET
ncbi:MAG: hypothetical protein KDE04_20525, partial [Anaerolineales bacterium]|nr:hypothetical protein [Anaerolineales bacterium]